jgi:hypothetical protein
MRQAYLAALLAGLATGSVQAAESKPAAPKDGQVEAADAELLEFLGSLDTEEEDWREFLEDRPIKVAAGKPVEKKAPPSPPGAKQLEQVKKP